MNRDDDRRRHAQYKSDPDAQAMHAVHSLLACWDDHESASNPWTGGVQNHQPATEGEWQMRREASIRAYYEWMPIGEPGPRRTCARFWRRDSFGDPATLATRHAARAEQVDHATWGGRVASLAKARERARATIEAADRAMLAGGLETDLQSGCHSLPLCNRSKAKVYADFSHLLAGPGCRDAGIDSRTIEDETFGRRDTGGIRVTDWWLLRSRPALTGSARVRRILPMAICRPFLVVALLATPALAHPDHSELGAKSQNRPTAGALPGAGRQWLPGDHHIHSEFSADYEPDPASPQTAPIPLLGKDGRYAITKNAEMARQFGLRWMVSTDHGGPNHSKLNFERAWPEVDRARRAVPEMLIFYGMEFDTPAGDHSSLIIPFTGDERGQLRAIEAGFSKKDAWPRNDARDTEARMIDALKTMRDQTAPPVLIANHPSRSATGTATWGLYTPAEFRNWNDTAPRVAIGMEGAPGHQAGALKPDGTPDPTGNRGGYGRAPTLGGFDQMTATLGGFWDSMLAESRRWFVTATSDSHSNWRDGGNDFWPGEYAKTYVQARPDHADIIDGLRSGRIFVTTGDLVSEVDVIAVSGNARAGIGGTLRARKGRPVEVTIRVRDPGGANAAGRTPQLARVDLITGPITGPAADRTTSYAPGTGVTQRFTSTDWKRDGEYLTMKYTIPVPAGPLYLRVRGTSTSELEPVPDPKGENPWDDLWFYANPIYIVPR